MYKMHAILVECKQIHGYFDQNERLSLFSDWCNTESIKNSVCNNIQTKYSYKFPIKQSTSYTRGIKADGSCLLKPRLKVQIDIISVNIWCTCVQDYVQISV